MKDKISPRSGILACEQGTATFYLCDYDFRIMNGVPFKAPSATEEKFAKLEQNNKYIHGITHDGFDIAVYLGNNQIRPIRSIGIFHSSLYAIQNGNATSHDWEAIDAITFRGGTLNLLFSSQKPPYDFIDGAVKTVPPDSSFKSSFKYRNSDIVIQIGASSLETYKKDRVELIGRIPYLTLRFSNPISFNEVSLHIEKIKSLISFMTFRNNVDFDEIALKQKHSLSGPSLDSAFVYSKASDVPTQKSEIHNICFNELEPCIPFLLDLIYNESVNNPFAFMDFIPESDKRRGRITNDMVKNIVTCLECELARLRGKDVTLVEPDSKSNTYLEEEKLLKALKKELKSTIKSFQENNRKFLPKTNDMLQSSIRHMTLADADKFYLPYSRYQDFIRKLFNEPVSMPSREDIEQLVIYRNKITHGTQEVLDSRIATTSYYLIGLIYCMILHSIGLDDNALNQVCMKHFLSY